ncbi:MAG TPA: sulfur carrier protein ThiS [Bacteroidetes bacterium]|nr:sulfur carrier protein ThiS [Bacteroidota bacterium]
MNLKVNGKELKIDSSEIAVKELLTLNKVEMIDMVSVQLNGSFVRKEDFETRKVKENDEVEYLYFMGGGRYTD